MPKHKGHPTFEGFPRILVRYGEDPQEFELFRSKTGYSLSQHEIRSYTTDLAPTARWWVARTTPEHELVGTRPRVLRAVGEAGRPIHRHVRPRVALSSAEVTRLVREGVCPPNPQFSPTTPSILPAPAAQQPATKIA